MNLTTTENTSRLGKFVLLSQSPGWISAIERVATPHDLVFAINLADLYHEAQANFGSVGLIELPSVENPANFLRKIAQIANNPWQLRLVALGHPRMLPWLPLTRISGFSLILQSTNQVKSLQTFAENHFRSVDWPDLELETRIESELPWPNRSTQPQTRNQN